MSLLKRMNFTRRMGTGQEKVTPEHFEELSIQFFQEIIDNYGGNRKNTAKTRI